MKHLCLFFCALVAACVLSSCENSDYYDISKPLGAQMYLPTIPHSYAEANPNGPTYAGRTGYYHPISSPPGAYHFIYTKSPELPPFHTPLKAKTWRYTSRYPEAFGEPIWLTTYKPTLLNRMSRAASSTKGAMTPPSE